MHTSRSDFLILIVIVVLQCPGLQTAWADRSELREEPVSHVKANEVTELVFTSSKTYADPFNEVELNVIVTAPDGTEQRVPAFWDGGQTWRLRYASPRIGMNRWITSCSDPANAGLHRRRGSFDVAAYDGNNPLYLHGPIKVAPDKKHFVHEDGTPFFWLADTWWMGLCNRLRWPEDFQRLTADRVSKGFTVVQIVAGLYPDMPAFDERGANEAGFPWTKDYSRVEPAYFDAVDRRIAWLADHGIAPCIVGAWGYHLPWLGVEKMKKHWRYIVARYGAYPAFWCVAGEAAMPYYLSSNKPLDAADQKKGWTEVAAYLRTIDPFHRLVSIHPTDRSRTNVLDASVLDFEMLQTGHSDRGSIPRTLALLKLSRADEPPMPTIDAEVTYEGILNTCHADVVRFMAWTCLLSETAGHTYGANGIWQVNTRQQPYGKSPHGGNWGNTPWDDAMNLPGSSQVGFARKLLEQYRWQQFEAHPAWATYAEAEDASTWGDWIWFPEGDPSHDAPVARRLFRRTFELSADGKIDHAVLQLAVDDRFTAYVNGRKVGSHSDWHTPQTFDVQSLLRQGKNVIAVDAENVASAVSANPAGLLCSLHIAIHDSPTISIPSDASWHSARAETVTGTDWTEAKYNDGNWPAAKVIARYGEGPWGLLSSVATVGPFAAGIVGQTRVIYVPVPWRIRVSEIEVAVRYQADVLDPATGKTTELGEVHPNPDGTWLSPTPPPNASDWVLILRRIGEP